MFFLFFKNCIVKIENINVLMCFILCNVEVKKLNKIDIMYIDKISNFISCY